MCLPSACTARHDDDWLCRGGAEPRGAESGGAEPWGTEPGGAATGGTEPGGAEPGGTEPGGAKPGGARSARVASRGASSRQEVLSPQELREWFARRWGRAAGAGGTTAATGSGGTCLGSAGGAGPGGTAETTGVGPTGGSAGASDGPGAAGSAGPGAARATGVGAAGGVGAGGSAAAGTSEGAGAGAAGASATSAGAPARSPGAVLGLPPSRGPAPPFKCPQPVQSQSLLQPVSPLHAPSPYTGPTGGLAERRAPASRPASPARPACTSRRTSRPRPPAVLGTHQMALRPSTAPLRVPLPSPPASSLPAFPDPESDSLCAASPTVARFLATVVTDPSLVSSAAYALVAELVDFAARCRLDYAASLVAESASVCPPSVGGECALSTDVLEDRQEEFQCFAAALPHLAAMDAEMASWKSTGTYVDEVPPPGANIVSGMWIFRVKRPPGSPPVFKARYVARGFNQRQGVDYFQTFSPTPKMTTLRVLLHVAAQRDYELHSLDFSTAFLQGSLHEEIWLRRPPGFTESFPPGTQWSLRRPVYGLRQAPREWHDTLRTTLAALGLEHRTKHIALRYFLARELQQRGQLRLAYVVSEANTADIFTKALAPGDHQRFCTLLGFPTCPSAPTATLPTATTATATANAATAAPAYCATMASLRVLAFYHEGRPVHIDTWLDDLQLYLLSDIKDSVSLFDHVCGAATAPPATADSATRSQWHSRDAATRLAIRNHLPIAECAHFGQHKTAQALYDVVVARYSSPATAALGRLLLPYLFPELSAFATVEDLVSHLRASDARYRAATPAEFLDRNQPPMFITLYFIVIRLPDSLRYVRDHFLSLDPTSLTVDLLEQHLLAAETSAIAVGAACGTPHPPFFEGCSPSPLAPSYASAAAATDVSVAEDVGAASASAKRRSSKGKGGRGGGGGSEGGGGGSRSSGGGSSGGGGGGGTGGGSGRFGGGGGGSGVSGGSGGGGTDGGGPGGCGNCTYADLLRSRIAIFDLDFNAILFAMYALSVSAEGECYRCVLPDPGIGAAALGASESGTLPGTTPAKPLHTFTLDSGASACFFRDSTTLTPLSAPIPVRLADPSGRPVVARSSTVLPCPAVPSGSLSGLHLPSFSTNLVSTAALQDAMVTTTTPR
ncbi:unnamed protein product, partial [Closterium sp. NIES-54]